ncbi:hypothetical protein llap_10859 [Limosa lapponica baueri]|uniref:Uncharacterized protein n=1 Tax=Limosa lapponica baueri TaxID=1758121 RepID=A0A2I0TYC8_LIMLA|nr:hypothetical protein llap_10859 [Limosa lapponica baueri]
MDEEKTKILNNFFGSVFTGNPFPPSSHVDGPQVGDQGDKVPPTVSEDKAKQAQVSHPFLIREVLHSLDHSAPLDSFQFKVPVLELRNPELDTVMSTDDG